MKKSCARAGIVMAARERYSAMCDACEALLRHTPPNVPIIAVMPNPPTHVERSIREFDRDGRIKLLVRPDVGSQNEQRNMALAELGNVDYVAFLDNDVQVPAGWLDGLIAASVARDAALVGPIYLEDRWGRRLVHMSGGDLPREMREDGAIDLGEHHRDIHAEIRQAKIGPTASRLRGPPTSPYEVEFLEFHCLLARADALRAIGRFDAEISTGAGVDFCLSVAKAGGRIVVQPAVHVTHPDFTGYELGDLPYHLRQWDPLRAQIALQRLVDKYGVARDSRIVISKSSFVAWRRAAVGVLARSINPPPELASLEGHPYAQTWPQLAMQLHRLGFGPREIGSVRRCHEFVHRNFAGVATPSGKPLLARAVGAASILAAHGAMPMLIRAAMIGDVYRIGSLAMSIKRVPPDTRRKRIIGVAGVEAEGISFMAREIDWSRAPTVAPTYDRYTLAMAQALLLRVAFDIDAQLDRGLCLSRETLPDVDKIGAHVRTILPRLGFPALADAWSRAIALTEAARAEIPDYSGGHRRRPYVAFERKPGKLKDAPKLISAREGLRGGLFGRAMAAILPGHGGAVEVVRRRRKRLHPPPR